MEKQVYDTDDCHKVGKHDGDPLVRPSDGNNETRLGRSAEKTPNKSPGLLWDRWLRIKGGRIWKMR